MANGTDSRCQEELDSAAEAVLPSSRPLRLPPEYILLPEPLQLTAIATKYEPFAASGCITV